MANISFKGTHTKLPEEIEDYVEAKFQTIAKFMHEEDKVYVELEHDRKNKSGKKFRIDITIRPNFKAYAEARGNDFHEAVDLAIPKIKAQLAKAKEKSKAKRKK